MNTYVNKTYHDILFPQIFFLAFISNTGETMKTHKHL